MKPKTGERYNGLICLGKDPNKDQRYYLFKCDCGSVTSKIADNVIKGATTSCGCRRRKMLLAGEMHRKHDGKGTRLYRIWKSMRERCYTPTASNYQRYGGRGVSVCEEWSDFAEFKRWAMRSGYADNLTLDCIDTNGNYEPANCRWATYLEQNNNKRDNVRLTYCEQTKTMAQWAREKGLKAATLQRRLKAGWSIEEALEKSV